MHNDSEDSKTAAMQIWHESKASIVVKHFLAKVFNCNHESLSVNFSIDLQHKGMDV